jgi:diaminohydroxyphosphoribosylaminopyrimidine deaminase/5-amino-6-(5-phosphoribosylamino)uracil reductase
VSGQDEKFMRLALRLAEKGIGLVEPNPAVGCVITDAGREIGKGYHKKFGGPHAEINAIENCKALGFKPEGATMYVTLEPCCHQGKTGPCTQAIIAAGIRRVVAATLDPSAHAGGTGVEQLQRAGIEVEVGLCEQEAKLVNAPFFKYATTGRCWVILKWAQTIDGKLAFADPSPERRWITSEASRNDAHKLRRRAGAVIVGIKTVLADDPMLTPRPSTGKKPLRVVLDDSLRVPPACRLLRTTRTSPVLIYAREEAAKANSKAVEQITEKGAELLTWPDTPDGSNLPFLLESLSQRGVAQVLVEGGPTVLASFLKQGLADEICVYIAPKILGAAGAAWIGEPTANLVQAIQLSHVSIKAFGEDARIRGLAVAMFPPAPARPE